MSDKPYDWGDVEWEDNPRWAEYDYVPFEAAVGLNDLERWLASPEGQRAARVAEFDRMAA